jgi:hypothetical protein
MTPTRTLRALVGPLAALTLVAACGGQTDNGATSAASSAPTSEPAVSSSAPSGQRITTFYKEGDQPPSWANDYMSGLASEITDGSVTPGMAYKFLNAAVVACNRSADHEPKDTTVSFLNSSAGWPPPQATAIYDNATKSFCEPARQNG